MLENLFKLKAHGTTVRTEAIAGLTTFLTAAYIIFVHPGILAATGMDKGALTTITCLVAAGATLLIALWANAPLMMAPGMGLNAFFTYSLVLDQGIAWQTALGVVFLSGIFFLILTWVGVREKIVKAIPQSLRVSAAVGIGLFIAFIGLKNLGIIVQNDAVIVGLGTFTPQALLGLGGLLLAIILEIRKVKGAILLSIIATTVAGIIFQLVPMPDAIIAVPPSPAPIAFQLDIGSALSLALLSAIFSFMFVDLFDSLGTMLAVCREAGMADEKGEIEKLPRMLTADAVATVGGALLGTSTTTTYIESASGVADGGRTGLTSVFTAAFFLLAVLFTPLIGVVPGFATAPALIIVGVFMMRGISQIDFYNFADAAPAFLTFILMPLTFSIANGLAFGFVSYVLIRLFIGRIKECDPFLIGAAILSAISLAEPYLSKLF
ncbi:MAG: guanine permease [Desulfuromonas sp.]|nr:MAG: guanine permease [Desulfuromonas sp.]